jgi:hypothetical protein
MQQVRALYGLEPELLCVDAGTGAGQCLGPAVVLVEGNTVIGDDGAAFVCVAIYFRLSSSVSAARNVLWLTPSS